MQLLQYIDKSFQTLSSLELDLGYPFAHTPHATQSARTDHRQDLIHVLGPTPLLMRDHVDSTSDLGILDQLRVRFHAVLGESGGKLVRDEGGGVETGQGDELPAVAQLAEAGDVGFLFGGGGHGEGPVEGG